jgi:hypothetical protein
VDTVSGFTREQWESAISRAKRDFADQKLVWVCLRKEDYYAASGLGWHGIADAQLEEGETGCPELGGFHLYNPDADWQEYLGLYKVGAVLEMLPAAEPEPAPPRLRFVRDEALYGEHDDAVGF